MNLESGFTDVFGTVVESVSDGQFAAKATSEPATMAILAFGGLAVLRKRRKQ